jgi:hypothetical protein
MADLALNDLWLNSFGTSAQGTALNVQGKYATYTGSVAIGTGDPASTTSQTCTINGVIYGISMGLGTMTGTGTAYLGLVDSLGGSIAIGTQAESGTSYFGTIVPITTAMHWEVSTAGTQQGTQALYFRVHYQK